MSEPQPDRAKRQGARREAQARGHKAETWAALFLLVKGYRVLERRFKTPVGEIDLIARKGCRIVFAEVKQRATVELCEAAVTAETRRRVRRAASWWMGRHPQYQDFEQSFDLVFVTRRRLPQHLPNAL